MPTIRMTTRSSTRVKPSSRSARARSVCSIDPPRTIGVLPAPCRLRWQPGHLGVEIRGFASRPHGQFAFGTRSWPLYRAEVSAQRAGKLSDLDRWAGSCREDPAYQVLLTQPPPGPEQSRTRLPAAVRLIENVAELCRDWAVTVKVVRVAAATPTVASAVGAPSTSGSPVVPSSAAVSHSV